MKQIPHPSIADVLARYVNDGDPEVQQVARGRAERASRPALVGGITGDRGGRSGRLTVMLL